MKEGTLIDTPYLCFDQEGREVLAGKLSKGVECCKQAEQCFKRSADLVKGELNLAKEYRIGFLILGVTVGLATGLLIGQLRR